MVSLMILCLIFSIVFESVTAKDGDDQLEETERLHEIFKRSVGDSAAIAHVKLIVPLVLLGLIGGCYVCAKCCFKNEEETIPNEIPTTVNYNTKLTDDGQESKEKQIIESSVLKLHDQATTQ